MKYKIERFDGGLIVATIDARQKRAALRVARAIAGKQLRVANRSWGKLLSCVRVIDVVNNRIVATFERITEKTVRVL